MNIILTNKKEEVIERLEKEGIETRPFFIPLNQMPPYFTKEHFPVAEELEKRGLNLPSSSKLKKEEIEKICKIIKEVLVK